MYMCANEHGNESCTRGLLEPIVLQGSIQDCLVGVGTSTYNDACEATLPQEFTCSEVGSGAPKMLEISY